MFNVLADLLSRILEQTQVSLVLYYLDDFFTVGVPESPECAHNLNAIEDVCSNLRTTFTLEKVEGQTYYLIYSGITLDTQHMKAFLLNDKLHQICSLVAAWLSKKKITKYEILSLVRVLQHATKVVKFK